MKTLLSTRLDAPLLLAERQIRQRAFAYLAGQIALWWSRARERRALAALNEYQLRDVGLTRADVAREIAKPFWRD